MSCASQHLLEVRELSVSYPGANGPVRVVDSVDLRIGVGEIVGVIGETGAGKSMTAWATLGLVPPPGWISSGEVVIKGESVVGLGPKEWRRIRGREVAAIVQNPRSALNPMWPVGRQIANAYRAHNAVTRKEAYERAVDMLGEVGIGAPRDRAKAYPHELSGGMAQRILIAMALINEPELLIADEPTTGLDVTIQAEVLDLVFELVERRRTALWLITHDLGVIANYADRALVMLGGRVVERGTVKDIFNHPTHEYTQSLIAAAPR